VLETGQYLIIDLYCIHERSGRYTASVRVQGSERNVTNVEEQKSLDAAAIEKVSDWRSATSRESAMSAYFHEGGDEEEEEYYEDDDEDYELDEALIGYAPEPEQHSDKEEEEDQPMDPPWFVFDFEWNVEQLLSMEEEYALLDFGVVPVHQSKTVRATF
jgi:hypothetical protein